VYAVALVVLKRQSENCLRCKRELRARNPVPVTNGGGGIENIPFLETNADAALVFATIWIEKIRHPAQHYMRLQYVRTDLLNFPLLPDGKPLVPFSWPHVSIATL